MTCGTAQVAGVRVAMPPIELKSCLSVRIVGNSGIAHWTYLVLDRKLCILGQKLEIRNTKQ